MGTYFALLRNLRSNISSFHFSKTSSWIACWNTSLVLCIQHLFGVSCVFLAAKLFDESKRPCPTVCKVFFSARLGSQMGSKFSALSMHTKELQARKIFHKVNYWFRFLREPSRGCSEGDGRMSWEYDHICIDSRKRAEKYIHIGTTIH